MVGRWLAVALIGGCGGDGVSLPPDRSDDEIGDDTDDDGIDPVDLGDDTDEEEPDTDLPEVDTDPDGCADEGRFAIVLTELGGSGVTGEALIAIPAWDVMLVSIRATGLEPDRPHRHAIVGRESNVTCPKNRDDLNRDGWISPEELETSSGEPIVELGPTRVGQSGELTFDAVLEVGDVCPLEDRIVVLYGAIGPDGRFDADRPVACGNIRGAE